MNRNTKQPMNPFFAWLGLVRLRQCQGASAQGLPPHGSDRARAKVEVMLAEKKGPVGPF